MDTILILLCVGFVGSIGLGLLVSAIRVVQENEQVIIYRRGSPYGERKGPGVYIVIPLVERLVKEDAYPRELDETILNKEQYNFGDTQDDR